MQTIQNKECTIMVAICKENIEKKQEYYVATDIVEGYDIQSYMDTEPQQSHPHPVSENEPQVRLWIIYQFLCILKLHYCI